LDWGEPALTIIDVRDRSQFNLSHITGAISMPLHELPARTLDCLEFDRDLYVYGDIDEEAAEAAAKLRIAGYRQVSELRGGLPAWKAVGYPIEATLTTSQT
jgi:rhodanese-related sulfurtransferase